jgi:glutathione reductase (NADPH)
LSDDYDFVVIGGGSGGVRAARIAAGYGARVAIIEADRVGGTCVIRGCVPKKLYVYAARYAGLFDLAPSFGWSVDASFDWPTLVANKDREIDRLEAAYVSGLDAAGAELIRDRAMLTGPDSVRLERSGRTLRARHILIATGGHAFVPDIPGRELGFTSDEAFNLPALPRSILIEGGGYVALEFATVFAGLGVDTTVIYRGNRVLRGFDEDIRVAMDAGLRDNGVKLIYETNLDALRRDGDGVVASFSDGVEAPYGAMMFACGRLPNVAGYGLEAAGVALNDDGAIAVDHSLVGTAVFAEPEAATIGLTETAAATHGDIDVYLTRFRPMMNSLSTRAERMMMKLITEANGGKVLGCHLVGPGSGELIQMVAIPMAMGATKADFDRAIAVHPTAAEELVTFKSPSYAYRGGIKQ